MIELESMICSQWRSGASRSVWCLDCVSDYSRHWKHDNANLRHWENSDGRE